MQQRSGIAPAVLNGANEVAVASFLRGEIGFLDIPRIVSAALSRISNPGTLTLEAVFQADGEARRIATKEIARFMR